MNVKFNMLTKSQVKFLKSLSNTVENKYQVGKNEVTVTLLGGTLYVEWDREADEMYLTGPADTVYRGEI